MISDGLAPRIIRAQVRFSLSNCQYRDGLAFIDFGDKIVMMSDWPI